MIHDEEAGGFMLRQEFVIGLKMLLNYNLT
jgi:hypothetical protein